MENTYMINIDLSTDMVWASYRTMDQVHVRLLDMSGGYGQPGMPLSLIYLRDNKTWLIGQQDGSYEDAVVYSRLLTDDGLADQTRIKLLDRFIYQVLEEVRNRNPQAQIGRLMLTLPHAYCGELAEQLKERLTGPDIGEVMTLSREEAALDYMESSYPHERVALLMLTESGLTAYAKATDGESEILFNDPNLGYGPIDERLGALIARQFRAAAGDEERDDFTFGRLQAIINQYVPLCHQRFSSGQPVRVYCNFTYPPIQMNLTHPMLSACFEAAEAAAESLFDRLASAGVNKLLISGPDSRTAWIKVFGRDRFAFMKDKAESVVGWGSLAMKPFSLITETEGRLKRFAAGYRKRTFFGTIIEGGSAPQRFNMTYWLNDMGELETRWEALRL